MKDFKCSFVKYISQLFLEVSSSSPMGGFMVVTDARYFVFVPSLRCSLNVMCLIELFFRVNHLILLLCLLCFCRGAKFDNIECIITILCSNTCSFQVKS